MAQYDYSQIEAGYYDKVYRRGKGIQSRWHHHKFEMLSRAMPNIGKVLDIGCGPGTFMGNLKKEKKDLECIGIDFSPQQIDYASRNYPDAKFYCADAYDTKTLDSIGKSFDVITIVEVIEHISNLDSIRLLRRAKELLKPSGKIIITTPNYHSCWGGVEYLVNTFGEVNYQDQHINRYNANALGSDLEKSGFNKITVKSFLSFSPFVAALSWRASKIISHGECYSGVARPAGMLLIAEASFSDNS